MCARVVRMANKRGPNTDPAVQTEIHTLAAGGWNAAQIEAALLARSDLTGRVPGRRTIQKIARRMTVGPDRWAPLDVSPDEARLVLPVLGELIRRGIVTSLDPKIALAIAAVREIAPGLPLYDAFRFAVRYSMTPHRDERQQIDLDLARAV